jgi:hypothetical protein
LTKLVNSLEDVFADSWSNVELPLLALITRGKEFELLKVGNVITTDPPTVSGQLASPFDWMPTFCWAQSAPGVPLQLTHCAEAALHKNRPTTQKAKGFLLTVPPY